MISPEPQEQIPPIKLDLEEKDGSDQKPVQVVAVNNNSQTERSPGIYEKFWPNIKPLVEQILENKPISVTDWQDIFYDVYTICSWDEGGCLKLFNGIEEVLMRSFLSQAKDNMESIQEGQQLLKEYIHLWMLYKDYCQRLPQALQQLDLAIKDPSCIHLDQIKKLISSQTILTTKFDPDINGQKNLINFRKNAVKNFMLKLWDNFILDPYCSQLTDPELLATHCDSLLRKTTFNRRLTFAEISQQLNEILLIIRLVKNKDVFMKHYRNFLIRRLILNTTIDIEKEEQYLDDLKTVALVPCDYTYKLHRMFVDLRSSLALQQQFRKTLKSSDNAESENNNNNNVNNNIYQPSNEPGSIPKSQQMDKESIGGLRETIDIKILNPSVWIETKNRDEIILPGEISNSLEKFKSYFLDRFPDKKLEWCHRLSHGTVEFTSDLGKFDLEITAAQLSIFNAFSDHSVLSMEDLEKLTNLNPVELKRTLWSLVANPKLKFQPICCDIILKEFKDLDRESNKYSVNINFALFKNGKPQPKGRVSLVGRLQV